MISSNHCRPRAMDLSKLILRSALIGRTCCRENEGGRRSSRAFLNGGLHQGISGGVTLVLAVDRASVPSQARWPLGASDDGALRQPEILFLPFSRRERGKARGSRPTIFFPAAARGAEGRCVLSAARPAASISAAGTGVIAPGGGWQFPEDTAAIHSNDSA